MDVRRAEGERPGRIVGIPTFYVARRDANAGLVLDVLGVGRLRMIANGEGP